MFFQQLHRAHKKTRCAISALEAVTVAEGLLHRMKLAVPGKPFDRKHLAAIGLECEHRAGLDRLAVKHHSASATVAGITSDVGTGEVEFFAKKLHQQRARLDLAGVLLAVDGYTDSHAGDGIRDRDASPPLALRKRA